MVYNVLTLVNFYVLRQFYFSIFTGNKIKKTNLKKVNQSLESKVKLQVSNVSDKQQGNIEIKMQKYDNSNSYV